MSFFFFLDQSDSFFHFQCLECPALVDQPFVGGHSGRVSQAPDLPSGVAEHDGGGRRAKGLERKEGLAR